MANTSALEPNLVEIVNTSVDPKTLSSAKKNLAKALSNWDLTHIFDANGDNNIDLIFTHRTSKKLCFQLLNGGLIQSAGYPTFVLEPELVEALNSAIDPKIISSLNKSLQKALLLWELKDIADFNGDSKDDLLFIHKKTKQINLQLTNGLNIIDHGTPDFVLEPTLVNAVLNASDEKAKKKAQSVLNKALTYWELITIADFNGDNQADIIFKHSKTHAMTIHFMNSIDILTHKTLDLALEPKLSLAVSEATNPSLLKKAQNQLIKALSYWNVLGHSDFNNDSKADLILQNQKTLGIHIVTGYDTTTLNDAPLNHDFLSSTDDSSQVQNGAILYQSLCSQCHGNDPSKNSQSIMSGVSYTVIQNAINSNKGNMGALLSGVPSSQLKDIASYLQAIASGDVIDDSSSSNEEVVSGANLYASRCASCHGNDLKYNISNIHLGAQSSVIKNAINQNLGGMNLAVGDLLNEEISNIAAYIANNTGNLGDDADETISLATGENLYNTHCTTCHGSVATNTFNIHNGTTTNFLRNALEANYTGLAAGMNNLSPLLNDNELNSIAEYIISLTPEDVVASLSLPGVNTLDPDELLYQACLVLAHRLPTQAELDATTDHDNLAIVLSSILDESTDEQSSIWNRGFSQFLFYAGMEAFQTKSSSLPDDEYTGYESMENSSRSKARAASSYAPAMFVDYIVRNDLSWKNMLLANYTLVNPALSDAIDATPSIAFENSEHSNEWEWKPAVQSTPASFRLPAVPMDHAGILSSYSWLNKYPSTATNRNRHRANRLLYQFMAYDIEKTGVRPTDFTNDQYDVPTMQDPQCLACHTTLEPIAGAFQDWGIDGHFWDNAKTGASTGDSLDEFYSELNLTSYPAVSTLAPFFADQTIPYYRIGDHWYRDMLEPGYDNTYTGDSSHTKIPGSYIGFKQDSKNKLRVDHWSDHDSIGTIRSGRTPSTLLTGGDWDTRLDPLPEVTFHMKERHMIYSFGFRLGRSACSNITGYEIYVGDDPTNMSLVAFNDSAMLIGDGSYHSIDLVPLEGLYLKFKILSFDPNSTSLNRMFIEDLNIVGHLSHEVGILHDSNTNASGGLSWLAQKMTSDSRQYAKGAVYFWYRALFKREPLAASEIGYTEQQTVLQKLTERFKDVHNFNVKKLLIDMVQSSLFNASPNSNATLDTASERAVGMLRVLHPHELHSRIKAASGTTEWIRFRQLAWKESEARMYYDFDGGVDSSEPSTQINAMMYNIIQKMAFDEMPYQIYAELNNGITPILFPHVTKNDEPMEPLNESVIRDNIVHLLWNFWGKKFASDSTEVNDLYQFLIDVQSAGLARIINSGTNSDDGVTNYINDRAHKDTRYVMRSWLALTTYLISDAEFVYE